MTRPFRLGATSFVWPDRMAPNVQKLGPLVDDVELLLFSVDEDVPDAAEVAELRALQLAHDLSYSVHTPLDASLASADEARRSRSIDKVRRTIAWATPLAPLAYTVHVYLGDAEHDPSPPRDASALDAWRDRAHRSLALLAAELPPRVLSVECIDYDFALIAPVVRALDLAVSLDVGHLLRDGRSMRAAVDEWLPRARILQLHGTRADGRDHKSLTHAPREEIDWLLRTLRERHFDGVVTLEVFDPDDLDSSLALVRALSPS